jgi:UDP:flavonoid glycosyltransferase YjiC (YdhE family)
VKIGIAINGEGRGHFSRARALAEILKERYEIVFWVPAHLEKELSGYFPETTIHSIPYLKFVQKGFSIDYLKTITVNAGLVIYPDAICNRIRKELVTEEIESLISDFEPFSSKAAKLEGIPVLQLNHPGIVTRSISLYPTTLVTQLVALYMMAWSDRTILCSFFNGDVGPIIRKELRSKPVTRGDYYVVYQKPMYRDFLTPVLEAIGTEHFKIFPDPKADYAEALAGARGLIAPAGFMSISEGLALGKPVFAIPVSGQYEQILNAKKLKESGFGDFAQYKEIRKALPRFISSISRYESAISKNRIAANHSGRKSWACQDDTMRAVGMIENFIIDSQTKLEWKRKAFAFPALFEMN